MASGMRAIAERVGVSKTTVQRALSNSGRISEKTRLKVLQAARELDFRPNNLARALRFQKSTTIGLVLCSLSSLSDLVLGGAEVLARQHGYGILVTCSRLDPVSETRGLDMMREKRVDGMIVFPAHPEINADYYRKLQQTGPPFVFIDREMPGIDADCVMTDNFAGGLMAGRHLISLGRREMAFACVCGVEALATSVTERLRGFRTALEEAGMPVEALIGEGTPPRAPLAGFAAAAMADYLQGGGKLDAVFAANDSVAVGVMHTLRRVGLRVPDDVSVVGFDGLEIASSAWPMLTTIGQPVDQVGEEAMKLLLESMSPGPAARCPKRILLTPKLLIGGSCGSEDHRDSALPFDDYWQT